MIFACHASFRLLTREGDARCKLAPVNPPEQNGQRVFPRRHCDLVDMIAHQAISQNPYTSIRKILLHDLRLAHPVFVVSISDSLSGCSPFSVCPGFSGFRSGWIPICLSRPLGKIKHGRDWTAGIFSVFSPWGVNKSRYLSCSTFIFVLVIQDRGRTSGAFLRGAGRAHCHTPNSAFSNKRQSVQCVRPGCVRRIPSPTMVHKSPGHSAFHLYAALTP